MWQLPQNLLGRLVIRHCVKKVGTPYVIFYEDAWIYLFPRINFAVSLGRYIIMDTDWHSKRLVQHEYGHCLQSRMLGWLYLIVVGIPSGTLNLLARRIPYFSRNYYNFFPEAWADKLGGVIR